MERLSLQTRAVVLGCLFAIMMQPCETKVVVFFPVPAVSHIRYQTEMARAVSKLGHESWVCIPDYLKGSTKLDMSGIKSLDYGKSLGNLEQRLIEENQIQEDFWEGHTFSVIDFFRLLQFTIRALDDALKEGLYESVKEVKPDLFVVDGLPVMKSLLVIPYKLGIQFAFAGSQHDLLNARVPFSPVTSPSPLLEYGDQMSFTERLHTTVTYFFEFIFFRIIENDSVAKYAPEMPYISTSDLAARSALFLAETDHILDYPRPMLPNTKLIGATTVKDALPLKDPYKSFMESAKKGVIVVTFGSAVLNVPDRIFKKMIDAFNRFNLRIVWRVNATSPDKNKVLTDSWIPQNDLLGHENTKLFISHCGKNGQYEALYHAVPILCLPIFADQNYNAMRIQMKGYGIRSDVRKIDANELTDLLKELLTNSKYKTSVAKASKLFRLLYKSPMDEAAFWLDHVMEYGGDYMRASSQVMPLYQFVMLDILAFVSLVTIFVTSVLYVCICHCCCKQRQLKTKRE